MTKEEVELKILQLLHDFQRASNIYVDNILVYKDTLDPAQLSTVRIELILAERFLQSDKQQRHPFEVLLISNWPKIAGNDRGMALHMFCALAGKCIKRRNIFPGTQLDLFENIYAPGEDDLIMIFSSLSGIKREIFLQHPKVRERVGIMSIEAESALHYLGWEVQ